MRRRPISILAPAFLLALGIIEARAGTLLMLPFTLVGVMLSVGALLFAGWRAARMFKASGRHGDRSYDRTDKVALSREYRDSESATKAEFRKRYNRSRR